MSNPEQTTQPSSATPNPSIIDSPEFQRILEKLHTDNEREFLVDIIKDHEHLEQEMKENIASNPSSILENMEKLNNVIFKFLGLDVEDRLKLMSAEVEIHLDVGKMKEVIAVMDLTALKISDISERGDYIACVADKRLEMKL